MSVLDSITGPSDKRLAVRVTKDAQRHLRGGHPWIFDGSIKSVKGDGKPGDLAVVFGDDRRFLAIGLWDPDSPIRIRVLHVGKPAQIDADWFEARLRDALAIRQPLIADGSTTGFRVVHGENDGLGGLVVDAYSDVAVVKVYSEAWIPHLPVVVPLVAQVTSASAVVLRLARLVDGIHGLTDSSVVWGELATDDVEFLEHDLRFSAQVIGGHKTGHFLDQRLNRDRVGAMSSGARVLDVFGANGGFSVHAAAGGATEVTTVDISQPALEAAVRNMRLNSSLAAVSNCRRSTICGDAFEIMDDLAAKRRRFDVVVVDPPSFAKRQGETDRAIRAYQKLTHLALQLVERDGVLVQSSCSSRVNEQEFFAAVKNAAITAGRPLVELERTAHDIDHPITFNEGSYLKTVFAKVG